MSDIQKRLCEAVVIALTNNDHCLSFDELRTLEHTLCDLFVVQRSDVLTNDEYTYIEQLLWKRMSVLRLEQVNV